MSLFNTKFCYAEAKLSLAKHPGEDLDTYVRRFHERALVYYDLVTEEVVVDVHLHDMLEQYRDFLEDFVFSVFFQVGGRCTSSDESITGPRGLV